MPGMSYYIARPVFSCRHYMFVLVRQQRKKRRIVQMSWGVDKSNRRKFIIGQMYKKEVTGILLIFCGLYFSACQRRHVCPAYNSSFILDQDKTLQFFSVFGEDSLPKSDFFVNKTKRGIIVKVRFRKKQEEISTVRMRMVYPPPVDSIQMVGDDLYAMSGEEIDSALSSVERPLKGFNRDQQVYMRHIAPYYGKGLYYGDDQEEIMEDDPLQTQKLEDEPPSEKEKKKRRWFWNRGKENEEVIPEDSVPGNQAAPPVDLSDF